MALFIICSFFKVDGTPTLCYVLPKKYTMKTTFDRSYLYKNFTRSSVSKRNLWVASSKFATVFLGHSGDLLLWVGVRRRASSVNIFFSRTTEPVLTKFGM